MKAFPLKMCALTVLAALALAGSADAQRRTPPPHASIGQRYGVPTYDGTFLHPDGYRSTAVPVYLDDGRTGELLIPSDRRDPHRMYYREDETGWTLPVRVDPRYTRQQMVRHPRAMRYEPHRHNDQRSWETDALIIGGSTAAGALIGAAAGGAKGAQIGAVAGGIGGLIYDLTSRK